ncbi:hypothetical protein SARC_03791 [Sphaeroforma arctica JP610]|uniref:Uncharacterized protein n=1 Tax=Sphaeroforma arctica JP610 TaxID=667725 RepID=A0A0L0G570_9EUKA|nr:hypothetical protein SARC_03791 [Sphaeroforma arctica JP610]KNC83971.1 hypothetical protein SARC_03791 [Sphaeroforma arctica JP610]|eukprot:XP_014157873.1 hypothetical protein SARC_03791 [Sphaeroforma arctica JP610]
MNEVKGSAVTAKTTSAEEALAKKLRTEVLSFIGKSPKQEKPKMDAVIDNFRSLAQTTGEPVANLIAPVLSEPLIKAGINAMIRHLEFGNKVMADLKDIEVDIRNFVLSCYPQPREGHRKECVYIRRSAVGNKDAKRPAGGTQG